MTRRRRCHLRLVSRLNFNRNQKHNTMSETPKTDSAFKTGPESGRLMCKLLECENERYAETLHDGYAVYENLTDHEKRYTTPQNVSATLDAFKRALANKAVSTTCNE